MLGFGIPLSQSLISFGSFQNKKYRMPVRLDVRLHVVVCYTCDGLGGWDKGGDRSRGCRLPSQCRLNVTALSRVGPGDPGTAGGSAPRQADQCLAG